MQPKKSRQPWYIYVSIVFCLILSSLVASNTTFDFISEVSTDLITSLRTPSKNIKTSEPSLSTFQSKENTTALAPFFATIVANADITTTCSNDGATLARFNLCGNFDNRVIALNQAYGSYEWQRLTTASCPSFNIDEECPTYTCTGSWVAAGSASTLTLNPNTIPAASGAEYRVRVDGGSYFYIKVKKSIITQTFVKRDFICGVDGRIQITNLSSAYEYAIDNGTGFGAWQGAIFDGLQPGTYTVKARLRNTPNTCEYPYDPIVIESREIDIDVNFVDANCFGENGSISVLVNDVPGPYKYTLLDSNGFPQEFTSFIASNTYTFAAVGFGSYSIQVETQQCKADLANGIAAPRQDLDVNGVPIVIGDGLFPLAASTEVNTSFGCSTITTVPVIVRTSGGAGPYTYTVNGGPSSAPFTGQTTHTVSASGDYNFLITDANGCTITASANVQELSPPVVTATGINGTCTNGGAKINFNVINARGYNLSYRTNSSDPWVTSTRISVPDGTYTTLEVRYEQGSFSCTMILPSVTVTSEATVTGTVSKLSNQTCNASGGTDGGSILFSGAGGGSGTGFQYSVDGVNFFASASFTNLPPGTYTPIIRDDSGCRLELTNIVIDTVDPPTNLDFVQSNINCALGTTDVQLVATGSASIANYRIISPSAFDNGAVDTFSGLSTSTTYTFEIQDVNGCVYTESFTPVVLSSIRARAKSDGDKRVCAGATDGSGTFVIDGFGTNYTYQINAEPVSAAQNIAEVDLVARGAGTYTITVTDVDTGCTDTATIVIEAAAAFVLNPVVTPMTCANGNIGRVVANTTGGWGGNRYTLLFPNGTSVGPTSNRTFGNLTLAGNYTLTARDSEGCITTNTFTLSSVAAPTIIQDVTDFCYSALNSASISVISTAGTALIGTHQYRINGGALQTPGTPGTYTFSGLVPGNYTIEVIDGGNCSASVQVRIPPQIRIDLDVVSEIPCGGDGTMEIRVNGGNITNLATTSYTIYLNGTSVQTGSLVSNPFTYNVPFTGNGDYTVEVTDNNGCTTISNPITFSQPTPILATERVVGPSCLDANSGFVEVIPTVSSGLPPFEVVFAPAGSLQADPNDPDPNAVNLYDFSSQTIYSGLAAGNYEYLVKDANNCITAIIPVTIVPDTTNPPATTITPIDASCSSGTIASGGVIINSIADGVSDFTIIVENVFGDQLFIQQNVAIGDLPLNIQDPALVQGNYRVITIDSRGCIDEDPLTIGSNDVVIVPDPTVPLICDANGFVYCVDILNGVGPFEIRRVENPSGSFIPLGATGTPRRYCFPNIQFGESFTVEVWDTGTNCYYTQIIEVPESASPINVALTAVDGACDPTGLIQYDLEYTITNFVGPNFNITVTNLDTGEIVVPTFSTTSDTGSFSGYRPGNYGIVVVDSDGCADGDALTLFTNLPRVDIISNVNANCNEDGQLTVRGSGGAGGPYVYAFMPTGITPIASDFSNVTTATLPGSPSPGTSYDIWVRDARNCEYRTSAAIIQLDPALPTPTIDVNNQCDVTTPVGGFTITVTMPASIDTPTFTLNGESQTPIYDPSLPTEATFTVNSIGSYPVNVIDANGCFVDAVAEVYQVLSAFAEFTTIPNCENPDGEITVTADGGSGNFEFTLSGTNFSGSSIVPVIHTTLLTSTYTFTNLAPGTYSVLVTDLDVDNGTIQCAYTVNSIISTTPVQPLISDTGASDVSCNGSADGSVNVLLAPGTDADGIQLYNLYQGSLPLAFGAVPIDSNTSGSFVNLGPNTYVVEVISDRNCIDQAELTIMEPPVFEISATSTPFTCEIGANRFSSSIITVNIDQIGTVGSGYQYSITGYANYQTSNTFEIIDDGATQTITVYAIDGNGCRDEFTLPAITPPSEVQSVLNVESVLNCEDPEVVRITVTGTIDFTILTTSATAVADVSNSAGISFVDINLPNSGEYLFVVRDNVTGCLYPMPRHTVIEPILPSVSIREANPIQCFGDTNGALFINVSNYSGVYAYDVYRSDDLTQTTSLASGTFDTGNYPDVNGDDAQITGLPGGNFYVSVRAIGLPKCSNISNVANIRTPNGALTVTAIEIDNVSCNDNAGNIVATGIGGWDVLPYEFRLLKEDSSGTISIAGILYSEEIAFGTANQFLGLASGNYKIEIRDIEQCQNAFDITLSPVDPIVVGIREPQGLICPDGNNAVLEAFDTTTGDSVSAIAGASGGVLGFGYKYQLLYLNSNDNTDINSRSGLQDTPTFDGVSSGFISAGWYAIEVSSSFECVGVSIPYYVVPPPPIDPKLVQVRAPGCGGQGQMRLSIENPELGFTYEYRSISAASTDPFIPIVGNSVLIDGVQGFYQYDVRKVGGAGACTSLRSEGITLVDAQAIDLVANLPDDISCATESDGRIESFSSGGIGNELYTLYLGNPAPALSIYTAFNPDPSATIVRGPQGDGTFENLSEGVYYIAVTSGISCGDVEGPLVVARPDPIVYTITTSNISCNGETDGSIRVEIISGGEGLVQFAINPNFNEFFSDPSNPNVFTFENLPAGSNYEILIKDDKGCGELVPITPITEPDNLSISNVVTQPEICLNAYDGEAQISITGGTPFIDSATFVPYYETRVEGPGFALPDPTDPNQGYLRNDNLLFENLQGGASYRIYVRDFNGCMAERVVTIGLGVDLAAQAIPQYGCEGIFPNSTVSITMTDESLVPDLLFSLDVDDMANATTTRTFGDLPAGDHTVYIYHSNGCMDQVSFTIDAYLPLSLSVSKTGPDEITAVASGGYGNYLYTFQDQPATTDNVFTIAMDANVVVRVEDERGCVAMVTLPFDFDTMVEIPNFFTPDGDNINDMWSPKNREYFPFIEVKIYDRYGRVVAVLDQIRAWDGTYEGNEVPTGDYWYVVNANDKDKQQYVGHFTLYR